LFSRKAPELLSNNTVSNALSNALSTKILLSGASKAGPKMTFLSGVSFGIVIYGLTVGSGLGAIAFLITLKYFDEYYRPLHYPNLPSFRSPQVPRPRFFENGEPDNRTDYEVLYDNLRAAGII
jgi:hypothetical protein